ncbi:MAG: extracellular solute-binding protein [Lachnospiraceae bacterium]|jgi:arabinogalactan oligomer/maltooligosaccharide transport system substrate-binding protein|nr:extracellular solute-binding protein [Lachnospiraceae bacterium]MCI9374632.1 extracellular solute-binding protein [Lachnospiraceae bacterium]
MRKKINAFFITAVLAASLSGCAGSDKENKITDADIELRNSAENTGETEILSDNGDVDLTVWGGEEDEALLARIIEDFQAEYEGQANFHITFTAQSESNCKDALMGDLEAGADVFAFADDQLNTLVAAGALEPVENADRIKSANLPGAVEAASVGNTLYAYPLTADNGYFLYYNKQFFNREDIKTFDRMLQIAEENEKNITMDWSSAWYVYSFFGNTGLEVGLNSDGITNFCTWNQTEGDIKGEDVANAMLAIASSPAFLNTVEEGFLEGVRDGSVIAGVSGVWNAVAMEEAWGADYGAARLPTYTCAGKQIQMASFSGYKLIGVNAYSEHYTWAVRLAEWISNEKNQQLRFEMRGQGPANTKAAASADVQNSPAITALLEQSEFSCLQRIGGNFWDPVSAFALNMAAGNPEEKGLQEQLDSMVEGITAP